MQKHNDEPKSPKGNRLEITPDTLKAIKYLLKSATNLCKSGEAKLILADASQKQQIIGFSNEPLTKIERTLINTSSKRSASIIYETGEHIIDPDNLYLQSDNSYILSPLIFTQNSEPLGVLLLKNKLYAPKFTSDDKILLDTLTGYFMRIWQAATQGNQGAELLLKFSDSLMILSEKIELERENLDARQLIGEIIRVSKLINSTLDLHALLESIMESAKLVIKSEGSSLMLIDEAANELYFNIVTGEKERELKQVRVPIGKGIAGLVAQSMQPLIVNNAQHDDRVFKTADQKAGFTTRNLIACPLMVRDKIIGVLEVINALGREDFSREDLDLFITFSEQAAIAIHNRELINSLQKSNNDLSKKVHELSSLHEVSKVLISKINEKELYDSVVKIIAEVLEARRASIMIYRPKLRTLELVSSWGFYPHDLSEPHHFEMDNTIAGRAFREGRVIHSSHLNEDTVTQLRKKDRYFSETCIVYPLISEKSKYGVINIADKENDSDFNDDDMQLVATISGQIMKAIENFALLSEMIEKKAFEKELEITSSIQKSILPTKAVESPHFELGFVSRPAKIMGGDFFDFEIFPQGEFSFHIADVSGKSLPAALFMAITSSIIKTLLQDYRTPAELLKRANDLVYKNSHSGMFVTMFYLFLDTFSGIIRFASAGHNEQFIFRKKTDEFIFLEARGRPLGVINTLSHGPFLENSLSYEDNDLIVLYTDGIVEAINNKKEEFGIDRFKALIKKLSITSAQEIANNVYEEISQFAGNEPQFDDFTLLILKMKRSKG